MTRVSLTQGVMDITVSLTAMDCPNCSIVFAAPDRLIKERREDGKTFYCPNGHGMSFNEREVDKLNARLRDIERDLVWFKDAEKHEREQRHAAERSAAAYKGQTTKLRKRAIAGACAFCHRHFADVERHVATKHAGETPELEP
jgi:Zn-finger nucleic acid-binding protein